MTTNYRSRLLAIGLCAAAMPIAHQADAADNSQAAARSASEQQVPTNKDELEAVDRAREVLARALYVLPETLPVLSIDKQSWPNSGLGCASSDTATINLKRNGYAITLATPDGARHVNVSGRAARICDLPPKTEPDAANTVTPPPSYDLSAMVERSREDLARRLKTPTSSVHLVSFAAATWPDNSMDCVVPYEQSLKKPIRGYRIQLRSKDRIYTYHTDLVRTRACPSGDVVPAAVSVEKPLDKPPPTAAKPTARRTAGTKKTSNKTSSDYFATMIRYPSP